MQLQSKSGQMICDYYPVKNFNNRIDPTKVLRVLTFMGKTLHKSVMSTEKYVNEVYDKIHLFDYVDNNIDHSYLPQFVYQSEVISWKNYHLNNMSLM